ncbi:hypothetical protein CLI82_10485 [Porphyromonas gingivalis]|nr:hypothetical protein CLI82_10485 [Porphyromonas gingivalis]
MSTAKIQIIRYFFKHNAHVLWAFTTNQKTNPLAFSYVELTLFSTFVSLIKIISKYYDQISTCSLEGRSPSTPRACTYSNGRRRV